MLSQVLLAALLAVTAGAAVAAPARAPQLRVPGIELAQARRFGPYATMRRANEVANQFRSLGYSAIAFHNGDGYYVDVR